MRVDNEQGRKHLLEIGHTPIAALPVVGRADVAYEYEAIMQISMAVISVCETILIISNSKGADFFHCQRQGCLLSD